MNDWLIHRQWYAALIALIALMALLGLLLSTYANSRRERSQWLQQQRREAYVAHLASLDQLRTMFGIAAMEHVSGLAGEITHGVLAGRLEAVARAEDLCGWSGPRHT